MGRAPIPLSRTTGSDMISARALRLSGRAGAAVDTVQKLGRQSLAVQLDQRDPKSIEACVDKVIGNFGRIDILVNNAAWNIGIPFTALDALTADIWDRVLETNLRVARVRTRASA